MKTSILTLLFFCFSVRAVELKLTPQNVVDRTLKHGLDIQVINNEERLATTDYWVTVGGYDFELNSTLGYEISQAESLNSTFKNDEDRTLTFSTKLSKKNTYGGIFSFDFSRSSRASQLSTFSQSQSLPDKTTLDIFTFQYDQSLVRNSFGKSSRLKIDIAKNAIKQASLKKIEDVENLVLKNLRLYWDTYIAQKSFLQDMESEKRMLQLVQTVRRKNRLGFVKPGELAQIKAELEGKKQGTKSGSAEYLTKLSQLEAALQMNFSETGINFSIDKEIPLLSKYGAVKSTDLRPYLILKSNLESAEKKLKTLIYDSIPELNLTAKAAMTGAEPKASDAMAEALGGTRPVYFVGIKFKHTINSKSTRGIYENQKSQVNILKSKIALTKQNLDSELLNKHRLLNANFKVAKSSVKASKLRKKSLKEIENSYRQARTDLDAVIRAFNAYDAARLQEIRALSNYHMSLNEYSALRDELVGTEGSQGSQ